MNAASAAAAGVPAMTELEATAELLAVADATALIALADRCLAEGPRPQVVVAPEVGTVVAQIREPIAGQRFHLGDVLACRAEVIHGGARGWAMRLGDDRAATLAAAICAAEVAGAGPQSEAVRALCRDTAARRAGQEAAEWATLAPTIVEFEELT